MLLILQLHGFSSLGCLAFIMALQYAFHIVHAAVAEFYVIFVENLGKFMVPGKCFVVICRKILPIFVLTLRLKGAHYLSFSNSFWPGDIFIF